MRKIVYLIFAIAAAISSLSIYGNDTECLDDDKALGITDADTLPPDTIPPDTIVPLPPDTVIPLPPDTIVPLPPDTVIPLPPDTIVPLPPDTVPTEPDRPSVPVPSDVEAQVLALGFPVIAIRTENCEEPTADRIEAPEGCWGVSITNANKVPGRVIRFEPDSSVTYDSGEYKKGESGMTVKLRGNTTAQNWQKPYKIKLQKKADLLVRGDKNLNDKNWVLTYEVAWRDHIGKTMSALIQKCWTPSCQYVNVVMNDVWRGLYSLTEGVERNEKGRINIAEDGFIAEHDAYWWKTPDESFPSMMEAFGYTLKYPDWEDTEEEDREYISASLNELESSILNGTYPDVIDVESMVNFVLVHDFIGTSDGGGSNLYFVRPNRESVPIYVGPAWDFDCVAYTKGFSGVHINSWMSQLWTNPNPTFTKIYLDRYDEIADTAYAVLGRILAGEGIDATAWDNTARALPPMATQQPNFRTATRAYAAWLEEHRRLLDAAVESMRMTACTELTATDDHSPTSISLRDGTVAIMGIPVGAPVHVYRPDGPCVLTAYGTGKPVTVDLTPGIYIVRTNTHTNKIIVR